VPRLPFSLGSAAKLAHGHKNNILHAVAQILVKTPQALAQILEQIGKLALHAAFIDVIVPAAAIDKQELPTPMSALSKLTDLLQALAQSASSDTARRFSG